MNKIREIKSLLNDMRFSLTEKRCRSIKTIVCDKKGVLKIKTGTKWTLDKNEIEIFKVYDGEVWMDMEFEDVVLWMLK